MNSLFSASNETNQNGEQISFFWEFFCLDLREIFAVSKA